MTSTKVNDEELQMNTNTNTSTVPTSNGKFDRFMEIGPDATIRELGGSERGCINRAIRYLHAEGASKGTIAKLLNKRFQHIRNVLHQDAQNALAALKKQNQTSTSTNITAITIPNQIVCPAIESMQVNAAPADFEFQKNSGNIDDEQQEQQEKSALSDDEIIQKMIDDELKELEGN